MQVKQYIVKCNTSPCEYAVTVKKKKKYMQINEYNLNVHPLNHLTLV